MEKEKVINPKTGKKIDVGGQIYNGLIREGYYYDNGQLIKYKEKFVYDDDEEDDEDEEESEEENVDYDNEEDEEEEFGFNEEPEQEYEHQTANETFLKERYIPDEYDEYEAYEEQNFDTASQSVYPNYVYRQPTIHYERMTHVRCIECNKPIGVLEKSFNKLKSRGLTSEEIYGQLNIKRYCCRQHLDHPPLINSFQVNENKMLGYPNTKVVHVKKTKTLPTNISKNPYLNTNNNNNINVNTNAREFEHGKPIQRTINYQQLQSRPLGSKYRVSYIGK